MRVEDDFETAAQQIFSLVHGAEKTNPGAPRYLYLDIQGHRNDDGGFDHDAWELIHHFVTKWLSEYLTEVYTPLLGFRRTTPQRNDVPDVFGIAPAADAATRTFDVNALEIKPRESMPDQRKSRPSVRMIAAYLGLGEDPGCQICWARPVERAHAVPLALGGSNDIRNFALLCQRHHRAAPDIADAAGFWRWMQFAIKHAAYERMSRLPPEHVAQLYALSNTLPPEPGPPPPTTLEESVRHELVGVWRWKSDEVDEHVSLALLSEAEKVMEAATTEHFGVKRKSSTFAWALHVARARLARTQ